MVPRETIYLNEVESDQAKRRLHNLDEACCREVQTNLSTIIELADLVEKQLTEPETDVPTATVRQMVVAQRHQKLS